MATEVLASERSDDWPASAPRGRQVSRRNRSMAQRILGGLASLKLTVALFSLAIFLVFAGTLAQASHDVWWVLHNYFRSPVAWIDFQVFFPPAWFPSWQNMHGGFYFPGGFTIGGLMALNLLVAHGLRFKVQAVGARLAVGLAVIVVGCLMLWLVISAGPGTDGVQAGMPIDWRTIWRLFLVGLGVLCVGIAASMGFLGAERKMERRLLGIVGCILLVLLAFLLFKIDVNSINPDSMRSAVRILWQVLEAATAALVLLAGCILVFRKRAGIVLLHAGIGLMMANELVVHFMHKEAQMTITEGQTTNYASDIRTVELAVIDSASNPSQDDVTVVPEALIRRSLEKQEAISDSQLPFTVQTTKFYDNSDLTLAKAGEENQADAGTGKALRIVDERVVGGAESGERPNLPAAYVKLTDKESGKPLGTYMLDVLLGPQKLRVGGKQYEIALRFQRDYKPYTMHLDEVKADMYLGTAIPRNYESQLKLVDPTRQTDRSVAIRMNEPFRYAGETFYQSGYRRDPATNAGTTTLQVVSNFGWMIPYVGCMIVAIGMLYHFSQTLVRFLRRREEGRMPVSAATAKGNEKRESNLPPQRGLSGTLGRLLPIAVPLVAIGFLIYAAIPPGTPREEMDLYAFGKLPVEMGGRIQPIDSLARNSLRMISLREQYKDADGNYQPAVKWLLDLIARPNLAENDPIFRIDNPDVLDMLGLRRREYFRYSWAEINQDPDRLTQSRKELEGKESAKYTIFEKKLAQLDSRIAMLELLQFSFLHRPLPKFPTEEEFKADSQGTMQVLVEIKQRLQNLPEFQQTLAAHHPPLAVPPMMPPGSETPVDASQAWQPYSVAWMTKYLDEVRHEPVDPATSAWEAIFDAYAGQDAHAFNRAVRNYSELLEDRPPAEMSKASPSFEAWLNHWSPFFDCQWLYFTAFCLATLAWLGWNRPLNRSAFWLIAVTFVAHTFALGARMYISGRPPITNLYATAIYIGWAAALAGLILESVYRTGYGNVLAAVGGFVSLLVADKLSLLTSETHGDTIGVMQAVLDTQFWLATHVTCVVTGYTATYIAGVLGIIYVVRGVFTPSLTTADGKDLARMIYGTVCFGMFFSFVGTVLGGLWADDSWGRFWGWDPKENAALIIVLWNALVLHARWDGLVKDRGLAVLAIGGNIFASWSHFGVNQLGVGLHSYGFTEGVLVALGLFCASQLLIIGVGLLPPRFWWSNRQAAA